MTKLACFYGRLASHGRWQNKEDQLMTGHWEDMVRPLPDLVSDALMD